MRHHEKAEKASGMKKTNDFVVLLSRAARDNELAGALAGRRILPFLEGETLLLVRREAFSHEINLFELFLSAKFSAAQSNEKLLSQFIFNIT